MKHTKRETNTKANTKPKSKQSRENGSRRHTFELNGQSVVFKDADGDDECCLGRA